MKNCGNSYFIAVNEAFPLAASPAVRAIAR
jgi:hypothetical protein